MGELLLELFSEEIPAKLQQKATIAYEAIFKKFFNENKIESSKIESFYGSRRITIRATNLPEIISSDIIQIKGPRTSAPEKAIYGFCRVNNLTKNELIIEHINDIPYFFYKKKSEKILLRDLLSKNIPSLISKYVWDKSIYWGEYDIKWIRPLHNILCIFNGKIISFNYGHIESNDKCYTHRFMNPSSHSVRSFKEYKDILREGFVILDQEERLNYIKKGLKEVATKLNLILREDEDLLNEVSSIVEYPKILCGKIKKEFLSVPNEIIISSMRTHQKYFTLLDKSENIAPYFLFVSNIISENEDIIIAGNEKVLSARLADAVYFYKQDLKSTLYEKSEKLDKVVFHTKLGSMKDKVNRICKIAKSIKPEDKNAYRAAGLCKSDLVSEVVGEFPELQGIMGYYYGKEESLKEEVVIAIRDHYKPRGPSDNCPKDSATIVALADKMDTLCGLFCINEGPTGSKDPFGLRRQVLGIVRIILDNDININLLKLIRDSIAIYKKQLGIDFMSLSWKSKDIEDKFLRLYLTINSFIKERLKYFFKDNYKSTLIESILYNNSKLNIIEIKSKLDFLQQFLATSKGNDLLAGYKRVSNGFTEKEEVDLAFSLDSKGIDESLLESEYEKDLLNNVNNYYDKIDKQSELIYSKESYLKNLDLLGDIHKPISNLFNNLLINHQNQQIANNRKLLLYKTKRAFKSIKIDFDKLL